MDYAKVGMRRWCGPMPNYFKHSFIGWIGGRVVSVLGSGAEGPG